MGADILGRATYECFHGCRLGGDCPGHELELWTKHGVYYVLVRVVGGEQTRVNLPGDVATIDAIAGILNQEKSPS